MLSSPAASLYGTGRLSEEMCNIALPQRPPMLTFGAEKGTRASQPSDRGAECEQGGRIDDVHERRPTGMSPLALTSSARRKFLGLRRWHEADGTVSRSDYAQQLRRLHAVDSSIGRVIPGDWCESTVNAPKTALRVSSCPRAPYHPWFLPATRSHIAYLLCSSPMDPLTWCSQFVGA